MKKTFFETKLETASKEYREDAAEFSKEERRIGLAQLAQIVTAEQAIRTNELLANIDARLERLENAWGGE